MKLISVPIAAVAALALSLPAPAFAQPGDSPANNTEDARTFQQLVDEANSLPVVADPKAPAPVNRKGFGTYPKRKGMVMVTPDKFMGLRLGHAAIVLTERTLVEAIAEGVKPRANDWYRTKDQAFGLTVKKTNSAQDAKAADWAFKQRNKPYNYNYANVNTRKSFYCSHLVWAAFKDNFGIDLNTSLFGAAIHPLEFTTRDGAKNLLMTYRKK